MMKMSGRVTSCCVALFLALTSVSAVQRLESICALKKIDFDQSVPKHSLVLLYWFANTVDIDNNNVIRLTFNPNSGDYGSHQYGNYERVLDPLPRGNRYYTVGNLHRGTSVPLPHYVVNPPTEYVGTNRDRIIIRVSEQNTGRRALQSIDQVYITQHYDTSEGQGTRYDPAHTYRVTINLLRQIREFSEGQNQQQLQYLRNLYRSNADDFLLRHIRNTWGDLAGLGLLLLIVIQEKYSPNQHNNRHGNKRHHWDDGSWETISNDSGDFQNQGDVVVDFYDDDDTWETVSNDSRDFQNYGDVVVDFYNDEDHEARWMTGFTRDGSYNTVVPWNNEGRSHCCTCCICCICCIASMCLILLCTLFYFFYLRK
ncbi:uncharacterized protein LOC121956291 [Plectropomus leopardus]|uniref:uncharacterized protein LOC121956291 n=1 Tax=Plectropomus leopardus TaxID=160734 RepID=UPI001C4CDA01|nr:uncharacterized protein LOC121956291 [Plectropomus leopardus]